ncbi:TPA: glycosyltransferase [Bacillus mycoides]|uniref:glycosyltransferase n=1 Tax=Bacillus sp. FSL P2-0099 TaxID=2921572 RepID=UPI0030F4F189|nr:glycosyltransferase [Bacillus mycoides]
MKVLHVLGELNPSGAEVMLREAARFWKEEGLKSTILSTGDKEGVFKNALVGAGYEVKHAPFSKSFRHFFDVYKLIQANDYNVIHIHTERANIIYSLVAKLAKRKRIIRTIHSMFEFNGILKVRKIIERAGVRLLNVKQVSIGNLVQQNERNRFKNETSVIFNWIDTNKFKFVKLEEKKYYKEKLGISDDVFVFTSIGNCSEVKNHTEIIKAMDALINEKKYTNFLYLHVGKEDACQSERELIEKLGLEAHIRFLGYVEDVRPILYASNLFIMPSLYEGFGIAGLEALGSGLPCVFTDKSGLLEFEPYMNEVTYITPCNKEIKKVIESYISGERQIDQHQLELNSQVAREKFDVTKGAKDYMEIYNL